MASSESALPISETELHQPETRPPGRCYVLARPPIRCGRTEGSLHASPGHHARRAFTWALIAGIGLLLVKLAGVLVLMFASVVVATIVRCIADPLVKHLRLRDGLAVLLAILIVATLLGGAGYVFGDRVGGQLRTLAVQLPGAWVTFKARLLELPVGAQLVAGLNGLGQGGSLFGRLTSFAASTLNAVTLTVLVLAGGIFMAAAPGKYARGLLLLFPERNRFELGDALEAVGSALKSYLAGVLFSQVMVGILVVIGLSAIGMPSAFALAVISATTEFVPLVGGFLGAVPGVLLGLSLSPALGLKAALVYLVVQIVQSNGLGPLVQQRAVSLPPALLLFAVLGANVIFGTTGVVVAAPMTVAIYTAVDRLWARPRKTASTSEPQHPTDLA